MDAASDDGGSVTRVETDDGADWRERSGGCRLQPGELVPGTRLKIRTWIGEGGMGQVYEAVHVDLGRAVALKVMGSRRGLSPDHAAQFLHEAQACARIESRFVVEVLDFGKLPDERPFFVMELLARETVHAALQLGCMSLERAVPILRQCCKSLAAVHEAGLVHRDIKPRNVVLQREDGRADTIRLVDFGVAAEPGSSPSISGTPQYMAPEQILGGAFDGRVDIYALGCMAYAMLLGRPPFDGSLTQVIFDAHIEQAPPPISELRPTLPKALDPILLRCLEKAPEQRWANPHELEAALLELQCSLGFVTPWDDLPMPLVDEDRRRRLAESMPRANRRSSWIMVAGLGATLAVGAVVGLVLADSDPAGPLAAEPELREDSRIEELTNATRLAASKAYWVYPPSDDEQATALHQINELEREDGPLADRAQARAAELRRELAETLVRLGDRYWSAPHGRSFALEYYALALVFVPELALPAERVPLTPVQLADLVARAQRGDFNSAELRAGQAMAILAEDDPERRRARVVLLLDSKDYAMSLHALEELVALVGAPSRGSEGAIDDELELELDEDESPVNEISTDGETERAARNVARATALVEQARAAAARGDRTEARRTFTEALELDSRSVDALVGLAELNFETGSYGTALTHVRKATKLRPRDADLQILLGDCYLKALRYTPARAAYQAAAERRHPKAAKRLAHLDQVTR